MKILIAGASGLVGSALVERLRLSHSISVLGRDKLRLQRQFEGLDAVSWSELSASLLGEMDVVINLVGENIGNGRWSHQKKAKIISSRVDATKTIASFCAELKDRSPRLFNASAIGIYGACPQGERDEADKVTQNASDFLVDVGRQWEEALSPAINAGVNVCVLRLGVVLSSKGGMVKKLMPSVKCGLGAVIGSGNQMISWVSIVDVVRSIEFLLKKTELSGPFNIVSDGVVSQSELMKSLAAHYRRPCFMRMPSAAVSLLFGEMGDCLLLASSIIRSNRLKEAGFVYNVRSIEQAWGQ